MDSKSFKKYEVIGYDFYKCLPEVTSEVMWAISMDSGCMFDNERFTTSKEIKEGLGDYVFESSERNIYVKYQIFQGLPEVGEDVECTDLTENIFIPERTTKEKIDYFVNIIVDKEGHSDKILILNWNKFRNDGQIIIIPDTEHEFEDTEEKTVTLGMIRDFMSDDALYVFPVANYSEHLTRMGKEILNNLITYKGGYN